MREPEIASHAAPPLKKARTDSSLNSVAGVNGASLGAQAAPARSGEQVPLHDSWTTECSETRNDVGQTVTPVPITTVDATPVVPPPAPVSSPFRPANGVALARLLWLGDVEEAMPILLQARLERMRSVLEELGASILCEEDGIIGEYAWKCANAEAARGELQKRLSEVEEASGELVTTLQHAKSRTLDLRQQLREEESLKDEIERKKSLAQEARATLSEMVRREQSEAMRLEGDLARARATTGELKTRLSETGPMLDKAAAMRAVLERDLQEAETRNAILEEALRRENVTAMVLGGELRHVRARRGELEQEPQATGGPKETRRSSATSPPRNIVPSPGSLLAEPASEASHGSYRKTTAALACDSSGTITVLQRARVQFRRVSRVHADSFRHAAELAAGHLCG